MALNLTHQPWWIPQPLTKEQMEAEIHTSRIQGPPACEFTEKDIHDTLSVLNLVREGKQYVSSSPASE